MSTSKITNKALLQRLERALRENLRKRKDQQRKRKDSFETSHHQDDQVNDSESSRYNNAQAE